jgi:hypothetical protein
MTRWDIVSAWNLNLELSVYFLKAKQDYTVRKIEKYEWSKVKQSYNTPMKAQGGEDV